MRKFKAVAMAILTLAAVLFLFADPSFYNLGHDAAPSRSVSRPGFRSVGAPREVTASNYITEQVPAPQKQRTVLIYMNGSDLETEYKAATSDLQEIFDSGYDGQNINIIIFTGGTIRWHTPGIPNRRNAIFKVEGDSLAQLAQLGRDPMGHPETLAGFINFGYKLYPAEEFSLILWNHGGGAITGFGNDERFSNPDRVMMSLSEIGAALRSSDLHKSGRKLEFLGFDTCLMGTIEMAAVAADYARFLVASEELEPDPGWDYKFLGDIRPEDTGEQIGRHIIKRFAQFYENPANIGHDDITTLSLTDLSKIGAAAAALDQFAAAAGRLLEASDYQLVARARGRARMFGGHGEHAGESDMIDLRDLLWGLAGALPEQAAAAEQALADAVIYKYARNIGELGGLSVYFPFENRHNLRHNLEIYKNIGVLPEYAGFIGQFSDILESRPLVGYDSVFREGIYNMRLSGEQLDNLYKARQTIWQKHGDGYIKLRSCGGIDIGADGQIIIDITHELTSLNGRVACLYLIDAKCENMNKRYAVPVLLNGEKADLIAMYSPKYPDGKITGAVLARDNTLDKKIVQVRPGDRVSILYYYDNAALSEGVWQAGEEFTVGHEGLILGRQGLEAGEEYFIGVSFYDLQGNKYHGRVSGLRTGRGI